MDVSKGEKDEADVEVSDAQHEREGAADPERAS